MVIFYIGGADKSKEYMLTRTDLNLMLTAGHHYRYKSLSRPVISIPYQKIFMDSGAFQVVKKYGGYPFTIEEYIDFSAYLPVDYIAVMDYPCEPTVRKNTNMTVEQHIEKTIDNTIKTYEYLDYTDVGGYRSKIVPVIQGWDKEDFVFCIDRMKEQGILANYCGVGTLCGRQDTKEIMSILEEIKKNIPKKTKLHGFGVKISTLKIPDAYHLLHSVDSAAWLEAVAYGYLYVFTGRRVKRVPYGDMNIDGYERIYISLNSYVDYVNYIIKHKGNIPKYHVNEKGMRIRKPKSSKPIRYKWVSEQLDDGSYVSKRVPVK